MKKEKKEKLPETIQKKKAPNLDILIKEFEKEGFSVKRGSDIEKEEKFRTGLFALDYVLDGGISMCEGGHRIEFFGAESSWKTTFALHLIKRYQEAGKICAFIDAERSYDREWGEKIGIKNEELLIEIPESLEQAGDFLQRIIPRVDLVVIDSIVGLIPEAEAERDTNEPQIAVAARVNSLICRKVYSALTSCKTTIIFINQLREKVGTIYGNPNTTSGGHALRHLYSTRIEFKVAKPIEENDEKVGIEIKINCVKNKKGKPYRRTEVDCFLNGFVANGKSLFFAGIRFGVIKQNGPYYEFKNLKERGEDNFKALLENSDWKEIENEIWKVIK